MHCGTQPNRVIANATAPPRDPTWVPGCAGPQVREPILR